MGMEMRAFAVGALVALVGCLADAGGPTCADGVVCAVGTVCAPAGGGCADPDQVAACAGADAGGPCTLAGVGAGACREGLCVVTGCGDGTVDPGEECDDGNDVDDDACTNACRLPSCGDGVMQPGEECDDGAANADDRACSTQCRRARCGDGRLEVGVEECDAGVANADDGACTTACARARCGDGHLWAGVEACDDGNTAAGDGCRADCGKVEACGDGALDAGEACDDTNGNPVDGCDACVGTAWERELVVGSAAGVVDRSLPYATGLAVGLDGNTLYVAGGGSIWRSTIDGVGLELVAPYRAEHLAVDGFGNVYFVGDYRVRRIDAVSGEVTVVAGSGTYGFAGDGGPAASALLSQVRAVVVTGSGDLFVVDGDRLRRIDAATGIITTVLTGIGNGGTAALGPDGDLYLASHYAVIRYRPSTGTSTVVAGTGVYGGAVDDGGPATAALLAPRSIVVDAAGNMYIGDFYYRVRFVDATTGIISTRAGSGVGGFAGDGGPALAARLVSTSSLALGPAGELLVADSGNHRIRKVDPMTGVISTILGNGRFTRDGDGGAATSATLGLLGSVAVAASGDLYIAAYQANVIRKVDAATGLISTIAGRGLAGFSGDGGPAVEADLASPQAVALDEAGAIYVADSSNHRVRRIDPATGVITTIAGGGTGGDGGPATSARLISPWHVSVTADAVWIGEYLGHRVRRVDRATGIISLVAGTGTAGFSGDGGPATSAQLAYPTAVEVDAAGRVFIADASNRRVRVVDPVTGVISTYAGGGGGFATAGDGGPATAATIYGLLSMAVDAEGNVFVGGGDGLENRVRRIDATTGIIDAFAGSGYEGVGNGDGGPALTADLSYPYGIAFGPDGSVFVSEWSMNGRVRRIDATTGIIDTVAGKVAPEGLGAASDARLSTPGQVVLTADGALFAGGASGTAQRLREGWVAAVAGRYPHTVATAQLARYRASTFGEVGGIAVDEEAGVVPGPRPPRAGSTR
ncbi:MAG: DUF4215 domain-containing protein [Kofleriaceae bacterium]